VTSYTWYLPRAGCGNGRRKGTNSGADAVEISGSDTNAASYSYYYAAVWLSLPHGLADRPLAQVRAYTANCGYTIVASLSTSTFISLSNNYPQARTAPASLTAQAGYLSASGAQLYSFYVSSNATSVRVSISVTSGTVSALASTSVSACAARR
jgi:hypothetical protein